MTTEEIRKLKKPDLHCHLGAMSSAERLWELAHTQGINLPTKDYFEFVDIINGTNHSGKLSHNDYLKKFDLSQRIQSSPLAVENAVYHAISDAYTKDHVDLLELRFNPMLRNNSGYFDLDMIIGHACIGLQKATAIFPVKAGIIISTDRQFDSNKSEILANKAVSFSNKGVIGFDISGASPNDFQIKTHTKAFQISKEGGLKNTAHTGEVPDIPNSEMPEMIKAYGLSRIGHGIRAHSHRSVLKAILENNVGLEICPVSNLTTGCIKSVNELLGILEIFNIAGVRYSFNTDGFVFLNTTVSDQYDLVKDDIDIKKIISAGMEMSFIGN